MRSFQFIRNEDANISIDFLTAVGVLAIALIFTVSTISSMMTPYSGYSKELYPTADRAITLMVEDEGYFNSADDEGTDWETVWYKNQSDVRKIGFLQDKQNNTLSSTKINSIMEPNASGDVIWWEYPAADTPKSELDNVSRAMGFGIYNFYLQIRPLDESNYFVNDANQNVNYMVGDKGDLVSVVRYSMLNQYTFGDFNGSNLLGLVNPTRALFGLEYENFWLLRNNGLTFSIKEWIIKENKNGLIKSISIDDETNKKGDDLKHATKLDATEFNVLINNVPHPISPATSTSIGLDVTDSTDRVTFYIPIETFDTYIPDWDTPGKTIYIQMEVNNLMVNQSGVTWFNSSFGGETYPVQTTLWVW